MTNPPLTGLRILDLTQIAVGPYATLLLGFMGAQVIKVESCTRMDTSRGFARPSASGAYNLYPGGDPGERPWNRSAHHVHRNPNKLGVTLDLATPAGKELLLKLAAVCDVLVENYRASVMDRLGLGYDAISQANPQIIYAKISSQGASGPEMDYGSLGSTLEQTAGLASITGYEGGQPLMSNETFPDPVVGILTVGALMAALRARLRTGKGAFIDLSQREVTVGMMGEAFLDYAMNGRVAGLTGNRHPVHAPQGVYPCVGEDSWVAVSVRSDAEWRGLCDAMRRPDLAGDARLASAAGRREHHAEIDEAIAAWTRERGHYQAMHLLQARGVPAGAVLKGGETIVDPHLEARGFWDTVVHPDAGEYRQVTTPWRMSKSQRIHAAPAPGLGEHNAFVLGDLLGLPASELDALERQGIIGTRPVGAD